MSNPSPSSPNATAPITSTAPANSLTPTWTEPPWSGWVETTGDALLILEAARRGLIPRVTRRLVDSERKMISSGSVFVFDEDESGIKRWTDGFFWSPSRILGNFLLYRETDKRGAGHRGANRSSADQHGEHSDQGQYATEGVKTEGQTLSRPKGETGALGIDKHRERTLVGSLTNSYKFKPDGLIKKTFSLTIGGVAQHLISYYKIEDVEHGRLRSPSSLPELACLDISPEYLDKTHFRNPPRVEIGIDGRPRYRGEADDSTTIADQPSPPTTTALLQQTQQGPAGDRRAKRFDPYSPKRSRKPKSGSISGPSPTASTASTGTTGTSVSPTSTSPTPASMSQSQPNSPAYSDAPHPPYPPYYYSYPPHGFTGHGSTQMIAGEGAGPQPQSQSQPSYYYYPPPPPPPHSHSHSHSHAHYSSYAPWPHYGAGGGGAYHAHAHGHAAQPVVVGAGDGKADGDERDDA